MTFWRDSMPLRPLFLVSGLLPYPGSLGTAAQCSRFSTVSPGFWPIYPFGCILATLRSVSSRLHVCHLQAIQSPSDSLPSCPAHWSALHPHQASTVLSKDQYFAIQHFCILSSLPSTGHRVHIGSRWHPFPSSTVTLTLLFSSSLAPHHSLLSFLVKDLH